MTTHSPSYIGPLNHPSTYSLEPGPRDHDILVTEDGRILKLRENDENWLLLDGAWYDYRTEEPISFGEDYPITEVPDVEWNPLIHFPLPNQESWLAPGYEVNFGEFTLMYRTREEAQERAKAHKERFGGLGGSSRPAGWYRVRFLSEEEQTALQ